MTQIVKSQIPTELTNRFFNANAQKKVTGTAGAEMHQMITDSVVWYDERMKAKAFPFVIEPINSVLPVPPDPTKVYVQNYDPTNSGAFGNVQYNDIIVFNSSSNLWETHPDFDRSSDYIVYTKGVTIDSNGKNYLYSHRDSNPYAPDTGSWIDLGQLKITPHNYSLYKQGGNEVDNEFYHISLEQYNNLVQLGNSIIKLNTYEAKEAFNNAGGPITTPSNGDTYLTTDDDIVYELKSYFSGSYTIIPTTENMYVYCIKDKHVYIYDKSISKYIDAGIFKHSVHNFQKDLQGGDGINQFYHLTEQQFNALNSGESYFFYSRNVVDVVNIVSDYTGPASLGDYLIVNSGSPTGQKLYEFTGSGWVNTTFVFNKKYLLQSLSNNHVWVYNSTTDVFDDLGVFKLAAHNNQENIQGGDSINNEYYHVSASFFNNINVIEYNAEIFVDVNNGSDTNDGLSVSTPVKTSSRIAFLLKDRNIFNVKITQKQTAGVITTLTINSELESALDKNKYLKVLSLNGVLSSSHESKTITKPLGSIVKLNTQLSGDYYSINSNIIHADSDIYDEINASNLLVSSPNDIPAGSASFYLLTSRFIFNKNLTNTKINYEVKVFNSVFTSNFNNLYLLLLQGSVYNNTASISYIEELTVINGILTGAECYSNDIYSGSIVLESLLKVARTFTLESGGFVLNNNYLQLMDGAVVSGNFGSGTSVFHLNKISGFIVGSNSKLNLVQGGSNMFTVTSDGAFNLIASKGLNSDIIIRESGKSFKNASCVINSGLTYTQMYDGVVKLIVDDLRYLEHESTDYLINEDISVSLTSDLLKIIDVTKISAFKLDFIATKSGSNNTEAICSYNIMYNGGTIVGDSFGVTGANLSIVIADIFYVTGDFMYLKGITSTDITCDVTIKVTRFYNE